jgi:hypothetical protein
VEEHERLSTRFRGRWRNVSPVQISRPLQIKGAHGGYLRVLTCGREAGDWQGGQVGAGSPAMRHVPGVIKAAHIWAWDLAHAARLCAAVTNQAIGTAACCICGDYERRQLPTEAIRPVASHRRGGADQTRAEIIDPDTGEITTT